MPFQVSSGPIQRTDPSALRVASFENANRVSGFVCANPNPWFLRAQNRRWWRFTASGGDFWGEPSGPPGCDLRPIHTLRCR